MLVETTTATNINKLKKTTDIVDSSSNLVKTLCKICFPLMLSALSGTFMIFLDRIILAKYETHAMIAATTAANVFFVFQFGAFYIAMIAEVFVGQFNGAKQYYLVGKPVWQMIWFSLLCALFMIPIGLFAGNWFIPSQLADEGIPYFQWMMIFGATSPLVAGLCAFFVGRGKVKVVTFAVIAGNILNLVLVLALVFGVDGMLKPMGAKGAAIATGISQLSIAIGLFTIFIRKKYRKRYQTHRWHFDSELFLKCIKIGFPNAMGHMIATAAWAGIMILLSDRSTDHITVMSIGMSIWMFFAFITEGLQQGVTSLAANFIGANQKDYVHKVLISGLQLQFLLALLLAIPLVIMPHILVDFFIPINSDGFTDSTHLRELVQSSCRWLWLAFLFDGMAWVIDGILTAAGDTSFIMSMNSIGTWLFCITPIYLFVVKLQGSPMMTLQIITVFCLILFASYYFRYKSNKWQHNSLITAPQFCLSAA